MSIRVLLADDHEVVRNGIKTVLSEKNRNGIELIGEAANGEELLTLAEHKKTDIYLLDISMPVLNGIETTEKLLERDPKAKVIMLSMHNDRGLVEKAMKAGAMGYILKESPTEELLTAIREVNNDNFFLSPKVAGYFVQGFLAAGPRRDDSVGKAKLTPRESEVLRLISEGLSTKQTATTLKISENTARAHRNNIMQKLDLHKEAALVRYALKEGISHL